MHSSSSLSYSPSTIAECPPTGVLDLVLMAEPRLTPGLVSDETIDAGTADLVTGLDARGGSTGVAAVLFAFHASNASFNASTTGVDLVDVEYGTAGVRIGGATSAGVNVDIDDAVRGKSGGGGASDDEEVRGMYGGGTNGGRAAGRSVKREEMIGIVAAGIDEDDADDVACDRVTTGAVICVLVLTGDIGIGVIDGGGSGAVIPCWRLS